jgi:hypothetical protein
LSRGFPKGAIIHTAHAAAGKHSNVGRHYSRRQKKRHQKTQ